MTTPSKKVSEKQYHTPIGQCTSTCRRVGCPEDKPEPSETKHICCDHCEPLKTGHAPHSSGIDVCCLPENKPQKLWDECRIGEWQIENGVALTIEQFQTLRQLLAAARKEGYEEGKSEANDE